MGICWPSQVLLLLAVLFHRYLCLVFMKRTGGLPIISCSSNFPRSVQLNAEKINIANNIFTLLLTSLLFLTDGLQRSTNKGSMFSTSKDVFEICDSFLPLEHKIWYFFILSQYQQSDRLSSIPLEGAWSQLIESSKSREQNKHGCGLEVRAKTILTNV